MNGHRKTLDGYTDVQVDAQGREYVVHKATKLRFYIRERGPGVEELRRARERERDMRIGESAKLPGDVTIIRAADGGPPLILSPKPKRQRPTLDSMTRYELPDRPSDAALRAAEVNAMLRYTTAQRDPRPTRKRDYRGVQLPLDAGPRATATFEDGSEPNAE